MDEQNSFLGEESMKLQLGLVETTLVSVAILLIGYFLNKKVGFLKKNNIPEPVVGGIVFALLSSILYSQFKFSVHFDMTLKTPLMLAFFTTVGLGASFKMLIKGGPKVALFLGIAALYLVVQNAIGVGLAKMTDFHPLCGLLAGSITLSGGHGTGATYAEAFGNVHNIQGTMELAMACATFGLVLGGLIGGPVARRLIQKHKLEPKKKTEEELQETLTFSTDDKDRVTPKQMMETLLIIALCMTIGKYLYGYFKSINVPLPSFICPLLIGILITNICDFTKVYKINTECVDLWGTMGLSLFLAMALMSLRLWELLNLAGPMLIILIIQTVCMALFAYHITFRLMGKDYDAAIIAGGHCGFGLGATPTAVANMEALVSRYGPSPQAFLIVPMVGAFFIDIANTVVLQIYFALPFVK